jgi:hypothetical protein
LGAKREKPVNIWNHAAENAVGRLNNSAAKGGGMVAKSDCDRGFGGGEFFNAGWHVESE